MRIGISTLNGSVLFLGKDQLTPDMRLALNTNDKDTLLAAKAFDATLPWRWIACTAQPTPLDTHYILGDQLDLDEALEIEEERERFARIRSGRPISSPFAYTGGGQGFMIYDEVAPHEPIWCESTVAEMLH